MQRYKGENEDDPSEYQRKFDIQLQDELNARGLSGVPLDEVPAELLEEAENAARAIVGADPDER